MKRRRILCLPAYSFQGINSSCSTAICAMYTFRLQVRNWERIGYHTIHKVSKSIFEDFTCLMVVARANEVGYGAWKSSKEDDRVHVKSTTSLGFNNSDISFAITKKTPSLQWKSFVAVKSNHRVEERGYNDLKILRASNRVASSNADALCMWWNLISSQIFCIKIGHFSR